jgi:cytochrome c553
MVLFYSSQPVYPRAPANPAQVAKGQEIFGKICFRCHGTDGLGNERVARIAGQQPVYLNTTLRRYRDGSGVRVDPLMAANTRLLTDADIDGVVAYVSTLH